MDYLRLLIKIEGTDMVRVQTMGRGRTAKDHNSVVDACRARRVRAATQRI
jgi:hypothetical protein